METQHPRFRGDLTVGRQATAGGEVFVVKDPATGRFYRFGDAEHFIASQLDGLTPPEAVRERLERRSGSAIPDGVVESFIGELGRIGLLEGGPRTAGAHAPPKRIRGDLLYLRFKAFDPDRFLAWLAARLGFVFNRWFLAGSGVLILWAALVAGAGWREIGRDLPRLIAPDALAFAWVVLLGVTMLHEVAHGVTCRRFGGEVHEMGFMLIYLQPALYCNVSEAWLFPEKSKRFLVTLAGAWFEMILWALATFTWRLTEPGTFPSFLALVVMLTSAVKSFFNLNPLIKLDGYYMLSDLLGVPNLRSRAFGQVRRTIRRLWDPKPKEADATPRERGILLAYGLLAGAYSITFLGLILVNLGRWLTENYQMTGVTIYGALLFMVFGKRVRRPAWGRTSLLLAPLAASALVTGRVDLRIGGEATILPAHNADVRASIDAVVEEIAVQEGQRVAAGDLLARLSERDLRAELQSVQATIEDARAKLRLARAGPRKEELALARATIAKARERLGYATRELERSRKLFAEGLSSREQLENIEEQATVRARELQEARAAHEVLMAGRRPEEIASAGAEVDALEARRRRLEEEIGLARVVSPISGIVTTPRPEERLGQFVKKGDLILEVHDLSNVTAQIAVTEKEIGDIRVGQPVLLKARSFPGESFTGKVTAISPVAVDRSQVPGQRFFTLTAAIDDPSALLRPEMTGHAKVSCGPRPLWQIATRRIARYVRVEVWTWW